jgi:hypothetical protein
MRITLAFFFQARECGPQVMVGPIPLYGRVVLGVSRYPTDHHL